MKWTKNKLREIGCHNPHNIAKKAGSKLYIGYSPQMLGRAYESAKWQVAGIDFQTDPKAHWTDYGHKTFHVFSRSTKQLQLEAVMAWCKDVYGITEWERDPYGSYQIAGTLKKLEGLIK